MYVIYLHNNKVKWKPMQMKITDFGSATISKAYSYINSFPSKLKTSNPLSPM